MLKFSESPGCTQIKSVTVCVTEKTARRRLRLKKTGPLTYMGIELKCVGSKALRTKLQLQDQQSI